jgi:alkylation response protein AidB-like acyl-CoA dehydrogenase
MDFALTPDQEMIRGTAEAFLADASPSVAVRQAIQTAAGYDESVWNQVSKELGWCATAIPEEFGGLGLTIIEQVILMEQMGRRLFCSPYFATACLAATALLQVGTTAAKERFLPPIASGTITATLAFGERGLNWCNSAVTAVATPLTDGYSLSGYFQHVPDGTSAQLLLVPGRILGRDEILLFAVPADVEGVDRHHCVTIDATRRLAEIRLNAVKIREDAIASTRIGIDDGLARTSALAAIALAAEQLGGAQQCLDMTLAYIAERHQFGRPISSFQAIKHRCAEAMVGIEAARSAVLGAACAVTASPTTRTLLLESACAKALASDCFFDCAAEAIQLHGGVGFTWEYDPHLYFKRAQASSHWLGDSATLRERVATLLLDY